MRCLLALIPFVVACSDPWNPEDDPSAVEHCVLDSDEAEARTVEVGSYADGVFHPYGDGQELALVVGPQGGVMITPSVRVAGGDGDPVRVCVSIALSHTIDGADDVNPGTMIEAWLDPLDGAFVSGRIDDLLAFDPAPLAGKTLMLGVTVGGPFAGSHEVDLVLRAP